MSAPAARSRTSASSGSVDSLLRTQWRWGYLRADLQDEQRIVKTAAMSDEATAIRISRGWLRNHEG